ncbi:hypothetical protein L5515_007153 [Caenorhabditis briggsae]|uniref:Receptor L-domain domain-containing protein n=1 Tax=Caenorhabditis briggsae TaxID=6238 RepID=A0AAE9F3U4_CAEBR|nr:hypothetical protein L5515_007153 [Caenorhabditis briggsae]
MHQILLSLLLPTLFAFQHQCGLPSFMGIDSSYPAPDPSCIFNDSLITRENLKRFPKDCTTVCANITFDSTTDGIIIINNPKLTDITAFKRWSAYEEFTTHVFGNSALDFEPFCDRDWDRQYTDFNVYGNLKNCGCKNVRIEPKSLPYYRNCTTITSGSYNGLKITQTSQSMDLSGFLLLKNLSSELKVYNTQLEDLSFLKNLEVIDAEFGYKFLSIMDNPNLKRLFESLKTILPENNTFTMEIKSNHQDFCITTNELQVLAVHRVDFLMTQMKLCEDLNRRDGEKVCHFGDLSTMDSDCLHIIGDVSINNENEKFVGKLKNVTFIYGSLTIKDGERSDFTPEFDQTPMVQIISNEKLQKVWLHSMRSPPYPQPEGTHRIIEIDGNSMEIFRDQRECLLFQKLTQSQIKYNKQSCCEFGKGNDGCVYMRTSGRTAAQWVTSSCGVAGMPFVCETPLTLGDQTCIHNYNGYCYLPSHELNLHKNDTSNATYSKASAMCASYNVTLASIHSKPEVDYIHALFKSSGAPGLLLGAIPVDGFYWNDSLMNPVF